MTPERWQQVKEIFNSAIQREPEEWSAFLASACGGDEALYREVESLIAAHEKDGSFIDSPAYEAAARLIVDEKAELKPGQTVGSYEIISFISRGGMGEVYLARDKRLGRRVALKFLPSSLTKDVSRLRRFEQEARASSALNHPNIITIYEIGQTDGRHFIATEFIEGETLRAGLARGRLQINEVLDIVEQVGSALAEAHNAGIIHRDIKPENIMLRRDGIVKVVDFGLAKIAGAMGQMVAGEDPTLVKTSPGMLFGTVQYMSPEQALGKEIDPRTDIFSLGVVLYEMAAGRMPFSGATATQTIDQILHAKPEPIVRYERNISSKLEQIVGKCLEKDREQRYLSARELLMDLKRLKQDSQSEAAARVGATAAAPSQLRSWLLAAVIAAVILVAIGGYLLVRDRKGTVKSGGEAVKSVAVLPFKPLTAEGRDEPLELGMTETLINRLSNIRQINVPSTSTVRKYGGLDQDPIAAGRELKVDSVLDGNIQRLGDRLRVTVRLTRIKDGVTLWVDTFNEKFTDIFTVQDSISERVAGALALKLSGEEQRRLAKRYTDDPEAYALYLKGRYFWNKRTQEGVTKGIEYFQQAVEKDPNYGLAYTGLADCYSSLGFSFDVGSLSPSEAIPRAKEAALKASEMDDSLAEAHTSLAFIKLNYDWDWSGAEREFKRAIELNSNYDNAHHWYSHYLTAMGRTEDSLAESKRALELDPLGLIMNVHLGWHYLYGHQYDLAIEQLRKTLEMDPNYGLTHWYLGLAYEQKAMYAEAAVELRKAKDLLKENVPVEADVGYAYAVSGKRDEAQKVIGELKNLSKVRYVSSCHIALIYLGLGEKDRAFEWLENAYKERSDLLVYLKVDPRLDSLRSDPRFAELVKRMGLS